MKLLPHSSQATPAAASFLVAAAHIHFCMLGWLAEAGWGLRLAFLAAGALAGEALWRTRMEVGTTPDFPIPIPPSPLPSSTRSEPRRVRCSPSLS